MRNLKLLQNLQINNLPRQKLLNRFWFFQDDVVFVPCTKSLFNTTFPLIAIWEPNGILARVVSVRSRFLPSFLLPSCRWTQFLPMIPFIDLCNFAIYVIPWPSYFSYGKQVLILTASAAWTCSCRNRTCSHRMIVVQPLHCQIATGMLCSSITLDTR